MRAAALAALLATLGIAASACGSQHRSAQTTASTTRAGRPVPGRFAPIDLSVPTRGDVWLIGIAACSTGSCTAIVHSSDGGAHFTAVPAPRAHVGALDSIVFANGRVGYVYDGHAFGGTAPLWQTSDGGVHWHRAAFDDLLALELAGGKALAVTATCTNGRCHDLRLRTERFGATTWQTTNIATEPVDPIVALTAYDRSIWLSVSGTSSTQPNQTLLHSVNGGKTFATGRSPCVTGLGGQAAASSADVLWATCPTGMLATAYRSVDAGATWTPLDIGREMANSSRLAWATETTAVLATGDQAQLLRTTDGGASFSVVQPVSAGYWNHIDFADATHGYALRTAGTGQSTPKLYASDDGGASWHALRIR